jgi:hypothetical protein
MLNKDHQLSDRIRKLFWCVAFPIRLALSIVAWIWLFVVALFLYDVASVIATDILQWAFIYTPKKAAA